MNEHTQDINEKYINLKHHHEEQMHYSGFFVKACKDIVDKKVVKKIIDRHEQLMNEYQNSEKN